MCALMILDYCVDKDAKPDPKDPCLACKKPPEFIFFTYLSMASGCSQEQDVYVWYGDTQCWSLWFFPYSGLAGPVDPSTPCGGAGPPGYNLYDRAVAFMGANPVPSSPSADPGFADFPGLLVGSAADDPYGGSAGRGILNTIPITVGGQASGASTGGRTYYAWQGETGYSSAFELKNVPQPVPPEGALVWMLTMGGAHYKTFYCWGQAAGIYIPNDQLKVILDITEEQAEANDWLTDPVAGTNQRMQIFKVPAP